MLAVAAQASGRARSLKLLRFPAGVNGQGYHGQRSGAWSARVSFQGIGGFQPTQWRGLKMRC